jgi:hypothetical protein
MYRPSFHINQNMHEPCEIIKKTDMIPFDIPTKKNGILGECSKLMSNNPEIELLKIHYYPLKKIKEICKYYKLHIRGNKQKHIYSLYRFMYFSAFCICIQKRIRGILTRTFNKLRGVALINRKLCVNESDFATFENITDIEYSNFFSFTTLSGTYGCECTSFHSLITTARDNETPYIKNPFTREKIYQETINAFFKSIHLGKIIGYKILNEQSSSINININTISNRVRTIVHNLSLSGHFVHESWFLTLGVNRLYAYLYNLLIVWSSAFHLTNETRSKICPPMGILTNRNHTIHPRYRTCSFEELQSYVISIIEKLIGSGRTVQDRELGKFYVLGCLTQIHPDAASSLQYLNESFR